MKINKTYINCFYCDNILSHPDMVGLLYLGFPRCMVLIPNLGDLIFSTYEEFVNGAAAINWLDPSDKGTPQEQQQVLSLLWNFAIEQEAEEERRVSEMEDWDYD